MKNYILLFASILLLFMSCRKDKQEVIIDDIPHTPVILDGYEPATETVNASVFGTIIDENGNPIADAQVKLNGSSTTSDVFGSFKFDDVSMNKLGTFVEVEAAAYFKSGRRFYPLEGSFSNLTIQLIPLDYSDSFESDVAATVSISGGGGSIEFGANSIGLEDGTPYEGTVEISTQWLSPTAFETINQMPGALQGVTLENEETGLTSYGMLAAELRSPSGQKLNIMEGNTATIKMTVPTELVSTAPQEIPLWSFNYEFGIWVEESSATLVNGQYVGDVTHFSFWNCDEPADLVFMDLRTIDAIANDPIQGSTVVFTTLSGAASSGSGYTNEAGIAYGYIPADVNLMLEIFSPCGDVIYSEEIGPFSEDVSLGDYEIEGSISVRGAIVDCQRMLVENGVLVVKSGDRTFHYPVTGNPFSKRVLVCENSNTIEITGGNLATFQQGTFITTDVAPSIEVGELAACGEELIGFFKITVDGTTTRYYEINTTAQAPDQNTPFVTQMFMWTQSNQAVGETLVASIGFSSGGTGYANIPGDYSASDFIDVLIDTENGWQFEGDFDAFVVTEYGDTPGDIMRGYASGNLLNSHDGGTTEVFVECEFADFWE